MSEVLTKNYEQFWRVLDLHHGAGAIQGGLQYHWRRTDNDVGGVGGFMGCLTHHVLPFPKMVTDQYGIPEPLVAAVDAMTSMIDGVRAGGAVLWFATTVKSDDRDLSLVIWRFIVDALSGTPTLPKDLRDSFADTTLGLRQLAQGDIWFHTDARSCFERLSGDLTAHLQALPRRSGKSVAVKTMHVARCAASAAYNYSQSGNSFFDDGYREGAHFRFLNSIKDLCAALYDLDRLIGANPARQMERLAFWTADDGNDWRVAQILRLYPDGDDTC